MAKDTRNNATKRISRDVPKGEELGMRDLSAVEEVASKQEAIAHLKEHDVDTTGIADMDERPARVHISAVAADAGFTYPNYRPLYP